MKQIDGIWWPDSDKECHPVVPRHVRDMNKALPLCRSRKCVVQAGGNVGVWAGHLANEFETVWTFEPEKENYACLERNLQGVDNIHHINAALGHKAGVAGMHRVPNNAGAHWLIKGEEDIPVITIDNLKLPACDLMILDTEGNEPDILVGARETLGAHKPVLMIEDKGLSERFGAPQGWTDAIEGYQVVDRVHRDVILVPE